MKELLKDYHLYEDLLRLNNDDYFQSDFKVPEVEQVFLSVKSQLQFLRQRSCQLFLINLRLTEDKNVFLVMKWLVSVHRIIHLPIHCIILEGIYSCLSQIGLPKIESVFQEYFYTTLVKSYIHYLQKLCLVEIRYRQIALDQNQQSQQLWFIDCNFLRFGVNEFMLTVKQFSGFLKECYPFLNLYTKMIEIDLKRVFVRIKTQHRRQENKLLEWTELQEFQQVLQQIASNTTIFSSKDYLLTQPQLCKSKVRVFLESGFKENLAVSTLLQ